METEICGGAAEICGGAAEICGGAAEICGGAANFVSKHKSTIFKQHMKLKFGTSLNSTQLEEI